VGAVDPVALTEIVTLGVEDNDAVLHCVPVADGQNVLVGVGESDAETLFDALGDAEVDTDVVKDTLTQPVEDELADGESVLEEDRVPVIDGLEEGVVAPELVLVKHADTLAE